MSKGRIALVAAGLLLGAAALLLLARGLRGVAAGGTAFADTATAEDRGRNGEKEPPPPRWQSFLRPGEKTAPPRPVVRFARDLADPFARPQAAAPRPAGNPGFELQGISTGARSLALVSGRVVREGDSLAGYRVVRIGRTAVTLAGPGGRLALALPPPGEGR